MPGPPRWWDEWPDYPMPMQPPELGRSAASSRPAGPAEPGASGAAKRELAWLHEMVDGLGRLLQEIRAIDPTAVAPYRRVARGLRWAFRSLFGLDLDEKPGFHPDKDGIGTFLTLAGFSLGEGAALAGVAKGEGRDGVVLFLYSFAVSLTAGAIWMLLRARRDPSGPSPTPGTPRTRAFDETTIRVGRWSMAWTILLALVLGWLAYAELLPNQNRRISYDSTDPIKVRPKYTFTYATEETTTPETSTEDAERIAMKKWFLWMSKGVEATGTSAGPSGAPAAGEGATPGARGILQGPMTQAAGTLQGKARPPGRTLVQVEQAGAFADYYNSFDVEVAITQESYHINDKIAFLVKGWDDRPFRPTYRQIPFRFDPVTQKHTNVAEVIKPEKGEKILIFLDVYSESGFNPRSMPSAWGITVTPAPK